MKILITSGIFPPDIGGPATYIPQLSSDLVSGGHDVVVVTLGEKDSQESINGYKVIKIGRNRNLASRMLKTLLIVHTELRRADALFSNGLFLESGIALTFTFRSRVSVIKIVGDPVWERARNKGKSSLPFNEFLQVKTSKSDSILRFVYNKAWSKFTYRIAPSLELCEFIQDQLPSKSTTYIPNGIDIPKIATNLRDIDLICVSRLVSWKNIDLAIRAASRLSLSLVVIGDGPERRNLEALARDLRANVDFLGQLESEDVKTWLSRARYFLLLSDYEGLSFALLEAMSRGSVPIVSKNSGNLSVVRTGINGLVVDTNLDEIVLAIFSLTTDLKFSQTLSYSAREHVKNNFEGRNQRLKAINLLVKN